ncbi:hypothetical protein [Undibacterium sp. Xuan67W]|uniref:hypothetical protein n=1 Tax=Undibacterium sp. Xuan67W TaxID=3413057 RepID=UPI003BF2B721
MKPEVAISQYKLGKLSSHAIVSLANSWLNQGIYTDSLNSIFMEENASMAEVGPLFEKAIQELGIEIPSRVEAAKFAAKDTIQKMVSGEIDLMTGANFLYWDIHHEISEDLPDGEYLGSNLGLEYIFCWLREVWDCRDGSMILYHTDLPRDQAEVKFLDHIKEEAEKWLAKSA